MVDTEKKERCQCPNCGAWYRVAAEYLGRQVNCKQCGERFALAVATTPSAASQAEVSVSLDDPVFIIGQLAVRLQMLTAQQLEEGVALKQRVEYAGMRFGEVLVQAGLLTAQQVDFLLSVQRLKHERVADSRFGALAISNGFVSREQVEAAMAEQKRLFLAQQRAVLIGDLLVEQGAITPEQRDGLLIAQQRLATSTAEQAEAEEKAEATLSLKVADDGLTAWVEFSGQPSPEQLQQLLQQHRIVHGVDTDALQAISEGKAPSAEPYPVAHGEPPQPGIDAVVEYLFELHPLKAGRESEEGIIDFKDRGEIPQVQPGTVLARKTPATPGKQGTDVRGKALAPPAPLDPPLGAGAGAESSADRSSVTAVAEGHPAVTATGMVSVFPEYTVKGDIGLKTGHVNFHGRVVVMGAVQSGFHVTCSELIAGEIQEAEVTCEGDITVTGGVIGARLHAGGNLMAKYLQHSEAEALGDVIAAREVVDSTIECGGAFLSEHARVLSSTISAHKGIFAREIGSESSKPCHLNAGLDERTEHEIARLEAEIAERTLSPEQRAERVATAKLRSDELEALIGEQAQVQDQAMVRRRALEEELATAQQSNDSDSISRLEQERSELDQAIAAAEGVLASLFDEQSRRTEEIAILEGEVPTQNEEEVQALRDELERVKAWAEQNPGVPQVIVSGTLFQRTVIRTPHLEVKLKDDRKRFAYEEKEVQTAHGSVWKLVPTSGHPQTR